VDATVDTGASRSFASEGYVRTVARPEEMQEIITTIALADRSSLAVKQLWRTRWMPFLVMPTMLNRVILGMDFLAAMGTQIQCGEATLKVKLSPSAEDPRLRPSKVDRMSSKDTSPRTIGSCAR